VQTLVTGVSRRALLGALGVQAGWRVLDLGCGFGPIPLELAGMVPVEVVGVDNDPSNLTVAKELAGTLAGTPWFRPGSTVAFTEGDAYAIPSASVTFDLVMARFVFQHLDHPARVAAELFRVVRPGAMACVVDADDGLSITYPEPSESFLRLQRAFGELQASRGGDRFVGRKLSTYLEQAGFDIASMLVLPHAAHGGSYPSDPARVFAIDRLRGARDEIVARGILSAGEVDASLELFAAERAVSQCNIEAHLAVVARRPV
jgi:ubiquinone/menaquinone biosynthesis C-methylase UbiE